MSIILANPLKLHGPGGFAVRCEEVGLRQDAVIDFLKKEAVLPKEPKDRMQWRDGRFAEGKFAIVAAALTLVAPWMAMATIALHGGWIGSVVTLVARIRGQ